MRLNARDTMCVTNEAHSPQNRYKNCFGQNKLNHIRRTMFPNMDKRGTPQTRRYSVVLVVRLNLPFPRIVLTFPSEISKGLAANVGA